MGGLNSFSQPASTRAFGLIVRTQTEGTSSMVPRRRPLIRQKRRQCSRMGSTSQGEPRVVPGTDCHRRVNAARRRRSRPRSDQATLPPSKEHRSRTPHPMVDAAFCIAVGSCWLLASSAHWHGPQAPSRIPRSAAFTVPSPLMSHCGSLVPQTPMRMPRSAALTASSRQFTSARQSSHQDS